MVFTAPEIVHKVNEKDGHSSLLFQKVFFRFGSAGTSVAKSGKSVNRSLGKTQVQSSSLGSSSQ